MKLTSFSDQKVIPLHLHPLGFIECFAGLGANLEELLENTDIHRHMINGTESKISYHQQNTLIENGLRLCADANLGLIVGSTMDWSFHGSVGAITSCSTNLKDAWNIFFRFLNIAQPECARREFEKSFFVNKERRIVEPILGFGDSPKKPEVAQFEIEFLLAIGVRLCALCGDKSVSDNSIHVNLSVPEPTNIQAFHALPCDYLKFGQKQTTISAHVDFVNKIWRPLRQHAFDALVRRCESEQVNSEYSLSVSNRARWQIGTNYFNQQLTLEDIAEKLHMTTRTLTRRLANEGTSFRSIFHEVRMELTCHHVKNSDLDLEDIASLMRFSSVASLRRAIKNWSGDTLSNLRQSQRSNIKKVDQAMKKNTYLKTHKLHQEPPSTVRLQ